MIARMDPRLLRLLSDTEQAIAVARQTAATSPSKRLARKAKRLRAELRATQQQIEKLIEKRRRMVE
jgi:hypothetical protein